MNKDTTGLTQAEERRRQRALKVQALALEGLTQAEIGKRVNLSQRGLQARYPATDAAHK
jgi:hypothetical protein